ncbi:hypothetical protein ZIOFF_075633 [Zingiber officinale]|uniref:FAF domain-containing protein n=2 Tax=Zingiber officinale TaxID=94328 RepID=A0A8J5CQ08_ZINOF|nr:hypothetical protein ZIOFF_075633 [Zingiber officinale]
MDPWAELRKILEHPLPEKSIFMRSLSWKELRLPDSINSFDVFGAGIHFKEPKPLPPPKDPFSDSNTAIESDNEAIKAKDSPRNSSEPLRDPEERDPECSSDAEYEAKRSRSEEDEEMGGRLLLRSRSDTGLIGPDRFPPPLSTIGRGVKPWVCLKSFKKDGRFVLKKIRVPTQQCLQATRENGRLMLHLAQEEDDAKTEWKDRNVERQPEKEERAE